MHLNVWKMQLHYTNQSQTKLFNCSRVTLNMKGQRGGRTWWKVFLLNCFFTRLICLDLGQWWSFYLCCRLDNYVPGYAKLDFTWSVEKVKRKDRPSALGTSGEYFTTMLGLSFVGWKGKWTEKILKGKGNKELAWVKREKETMGFQVFIQLNPSNSWFNYNIHILNMQGFDFLQWIYDTLKKMKVADHILHV